jgi:hypothetical protein
MQHRSSCSPGPPSHMHKRHGHNRCAGSRKHGRYQRIRPFVFPQLFLCLPLLYAWGRVGSWVKTQTPKFGPLLHLLDSRRRFMLFSASPGAHLAWFSNMRNREEVDANLSTWIHLLVPHGQHLSWIPRFHRPCLTTLFNHGFQLPLFLYLHSRPCPACMLYQKTSRAWQDDNSPMIGSRGSGSTSRTETGSASQATRASFTPRQICGADTYAAHSQHVHAIFYKDGSIFVTSLWCFFFFWHLYALCCQCVKLRLRLSLFVEDHGRPCPSILHLCLCWTYQLQLA